MKINKGDGVEYLVYLGGSHLETTGWKSIFAQCSRQISYNKQFTIKGIDPLCRDINEANYKEIVERDVALLANDRIKYVLLYSINSQAVLSEGTACELMLANHLRKKILIIRNEELQGEMSLATHPFSQYFSDTIVNSVKEALEWISNDISGMKVPSSLAERVDFIKKHYSFSEDDFN